MSLPRFFKQPKHQRFDYIPRFYDPDKEDLERKKKIYNSEHNEKDAMKSRISQGLRRKAAYQAGDSYKKQNRKIGYLRLLILAILILLIFVFMQSYLPQILEMIS
jgi:hypothetical protein